MDDEHIQVFASRSKEYDVFYSAAYRIYIKDLASRLPKGMDNPLAATKETYPQQPAEE